MDYRDFLAGPAERMVLPYFGGTRVDAPDRPLRLAGDPIEPGWWRFDVSGRNARPIKRADPIELDGCPAVRGHVAGGYLFRSGSEVERFGLELELEPEPLAPCTGRRWYGGELLFGALEFEDEAEERVRAALDAREPIAGIKGVPPSLRAAFAHALVSSLAAERSIPIAARESLAAVSELAAEGAAAAERLLERIVARREREQVRTAARRARPVRRGPATRRQLDEVLEGAGARLLRWRELGGGSVEVSFMFMGERFTSIVASRTLQIIDAGICLSGADSELTLDSLPSAIREAIETGQLYITRR